MHGLRNSLALIAMALGCGTGTQMHQLQQQDIHLMDAPEFFVCGSGIDGMDGKYVLQSDDESNRSDPNTPVYYREDEDEEDSDATSLTVKKQQQQKDFRLLRHRGFWMFVDVGAWPPVTHFRCDPTKRKLVSQFIDLLVVCQMNLPIPPSMGYSPALRDHFVSHLVLSTSACSITADASTSPALERADNDIEAVSELAQDAPAVLASRSSEL